MTARRGRGRPRDSETDTGAAIAAAALARFAAQGFEATSLREIASDAKVDVALIAYRFGGKIGLWRLVVTQSAADLQDALSRALGETEGLPALDRLRHAMQAFLDHLLARPEVPRLLLRDITLDTERSQWLLDELSLPLHRHFFELAEAAATAGELDREHLRFRIANFIYSAASTVARRDRLSRLVDGIGDDREFAAALDAVLIEGALRRD